MPRSHTRTDHATPDDDLQQVLCGLEQDLRELSQRWPAAQDFERFEDRVHHLFIAAERAVLRRELAQLDVDRPALTIAKQRYHRVLRATETYTSAVGPITVMRTLYRAGKEQAVVPLELRAGIIGGHWTPRAAHQASFLVAHMTPREGAETLRELGNMNPSKSSLDRLPKQLSSRWEDQREAFEEALRAPHSVPAEATTLVTERLKRSGMRWREAGGQAILTLRGWAQSGGFSAAWSLLSKTYRTEVSVPDNVTELAHGRAA